MKKEIKALAKQLPKKFKLGGFVFNLRTEKDWLINDNKENSWGLFSSMREELVIGNLEGMPSKTALVGILWHELFHAMHYQQQLPKKAKEEELAQSFEQAFLMLIIDNPWLLPWTIKGTK